ncbi:MAG: two-component sensor histidine kinase [Archangium gephyra]|uniref:histidine kinase n=1 Tax=Archangium gephyra TaxID=48 RepID=A0A2W5TPM5_9BACT|nr:MAG: two-component sensor histidine kinase [Archangium gephyra]
MNSWAAVHVLAATSGLVVAALALSRGSPSPLRRPLALLGAVQFAWNAASTGLQLTRHEAYSWLGTIAAPFFPPLALYFVLIFVGRRTRRRTLLRASWVFFVAQSLCSLVELIIPGEQLPGGLVVTAEVLLVTSLPLAAWGIVEVALHLKRVTTPLERNRSQVLLFAIVVVVALLVTDPLADMGLQLPRLSALGSFTFNVLLLHLTLGLGLFKSERPRRVALGQAVVVGLLFATSYLVFYLAFQDRMGVLITALTALSLVLAIITWLFVNSASAAKVGLERFATLGRFSAQMAHDLKNPLAAAIGASEYLAEELRRDGREDTRAMSELVVQQLQRLGTVIDRYQRLSRLEAQRAPTDVNALVTKVLSLQSFAAGHGIAIDTRLTQPAPRPAIDADLLASALENLVKNGIEAMPKGGTLTVSTDVQRDDEARVVIAVRDTGTGLDARALEQAFEPFFTTKATGSGLGLAFVREVAQAHGGDVGLVSREGAGTTVSLWIPADIDSNE